MRIAAILITLYVLVSLMSYSPYDPGLHSTSSNEEIANIGGSVGANIAGVAVWVFGFAPILVVALLLARLVIDWMSSSVPSLKKYFNSANDLFGYLIIWCGFLGGLIFAAGLEANHNLGNAQALGKNAGGIMGDITSSTLRELFGSVGASVILLAGFVISVTWILGVKWLPLMDRTGEILVDAWHKVFGNKGVAKVGAGAASVAAGAASTASTAAAAGAGHIKKAFSSLKERFQPDEWEEEEEDDDDLDEDGLDDDSDDNDSDDNDSDDDFELETNVGRNSDDLGLSPLKRDRDAVIINPQALDEEGEDSDEDDDDDGEEFFRDIDVRGKRSLKTNPAGKAPSLKASRDDGSEKGVASLRVPESHKTTEGGLRLRSADSYTKQNTGAEQKEKWRRQAKRNALPPVNLLEDHVTEKSGEDKEYHREMTQRIEENLASFNVIAQVKRIQSGPVITRYELEPAAGVKVSQISNLSNDLARAMSVKSVRVVENIPGTTYVGLEVPNANRQIVSFKQGITSKTFKEHSGELPLMLGDDITGKTVVADLAKMPHLLVAGTTGSGKSVCINALIASLIYKCTPQQVRFILIDPKMLELSVYEGIPHLLAPVVTDMQQAGSALRWALGEMEQRYKLMSALKVRNIGAYNEKILAAKANNEAIIDPLQKPGEEPQALEEMPYIVVVIDELADLLMVVGKKVEELIARLAQKARAAGIHLILATQRPSVDVITGLIKANIPTRIGFQVSSKVDSRTVLDQMGAEQLLGHGDMLFLPPGSGHTQRVHGAFVSDEEITQVIEYLKVAGAPDYIEGVLETPEQSSSGAEAGSAGEEDELYDDALAIVTKTRRASISAVQRQLRIGYNRAARLIEAMEAAGVVGPMQSNGSREVLAPEPVGDD